MILGGFIFVLCVFLVFYSYVAYPLLLRLFAVGKKENQKIYQRGDDDLPQVHIIFAAYNEEKIIAEKLSSVFDTDYPIEKIQVWVGSDNSTDQTDAIVRDCQRRFAALHFTPFSGRNGKSKILNSLAEQILGADTESVWILTDANVLFTRETIYELVKHFKNEAIGQVAANILNKGVRKDGISFQEKAYIQRENTIKYLEGLNWGCTMGAFGACYALRQSCWQTIPANTLMEDFYLSMHVLTENYQAIKELNAVCYEDVSNDVREEFKRKTRIQAGNFQNLRIYWRTLFRGDAVAFCFFSHKVLRWLGPLWIVGAWWGNFLLLSAASSQSELYLLLLLCLLGQSFLLISPLVEQGLRNLGIHLKLLRFAAYFYLMNMALVKGFWMYAKGIKSGAWKPTKRNTL